MTSEYMQGMDMLFCSECLKMLKESGSPAEQLYFRVCRNPLVFGKFLEIRDYDEQVAFFLKNKGLITLTDIPIDSYRAEPNFVTTHWGEVFFCSGSHSEVKK